MQAGQPALVALAVRRDVLLVTGPQSPDGLLNLDAAARLAHLLRGEVGVAARPVPVAGDGLGVEGDVHLEVLAHALQDVARRPELVSGVDALGWATRYSHWPGITSAFVPEISMPA